MFNLKRVHILRIATLGCVLGTVFAFQNCSGGGTQLAASVSSSSTGNPQQPIQLGGPTGVPVLQMQASSAQPVLADRIYLDSLFTDIFGPSARTVNSSSSAGLRMWQDAPNHGAPCSIYENYYYLNTAGARVQVDSINTCGSGTDAFLISPAMPSATVTRQALLTRACSDLTTNNTTLAYATAKIGTGTPAATSANILTAFHLFYRIQPDPDTNTMAKLAAIFPSDQTPTQDNWRDEIYAICISSFWQAL